MTNKQLFGPINLDGLSIEADDYQDASFVFSLYASYAQDKAYAIDYRLAGDIEAALSFENAAETVYKRLPQWAKW